MKKYLLFSLLGFASAFVYAQNIGINATGAVAVPSAMLDVSSTTSGVLIPRMTQAQRNAIAAPAPSLLIYQTDNTPGYYYHNGSTWVPLFSSNTGWSLTGNAGTSPATNFVGTTDNQALVFRANNTERMRIAETGNVLVGVNTVPLASAAFSAVANPTFSVGALALANGGLSFSSQQQNGNSDAANLQNTAANGAGVGFALYARSNQIGGSTGVFNLRSNSYIANASIAAITDASIAGGIGIIADASNATSVAVQGQTSGAGASIGVVGFNSGTNIQATGIYGVASATTAGSAFTTNNCRKSVYGQGNSASGSYRFGVYGNGGVSIRSGGVIGHNSGGTFYSAGALGYYTSGSADVAVYGFGGAYTAGGAGGFTPNSYDNSELYASKEKAMGLIKKINSFSIDDEVMFHTWSDQKPNATVGLGIYGGVMGGWIKGLVYGTNLAGAKYGVYVHGKTITNNIITTLNDVGENKRIATYSPSAMKVDITERGRVKLINGKADVYFSEEFTKLLSENEDITITVTPIGASKGVYIERYSTSGFAVAENDGGNSSIEVNWIAIGVKSGFENPKISPEIIEKDFEIKMNGNHGIMYNDNNPLSPFYSIWYDGKNVRFDKPSIEKIPEEPFKTMIKPLDGNDRKKVDAFQIR